MKIIDINTFEGKNIYSYKKCIRMDLNLEGYCETPSCKIKGFNERLVKLVPELKTHRCGIDEEGGFVKRLKEGTYLAHICEHTIIALQNRLGIEVCYGKAREILGDDYYIIFQYQYKETAIAIAKLVVDMINSLIRDIEPNIDNSFEEIKNLYIDEKLGPSTESIINAAKDMGIPSLRIGDRSVFQLGYCKNAKFIQATIGHNTSCVSTEVACDKLLAKELLYRNSIKIAVGGKVRNKFDLLVQAERIGFPVVLKPRYGNQGKGVFVNLKNEKELLDTYELLTQKFSDIMIEKYIVGKDYRVCVVDYEVVAVAERIAPYIIGDGIKTINELINEINLNPKRGEGHESPLTKIRIDEELIKNISSEGFTLSDIIPKGKKIVLRQNANISTGGIAIDCTDVICKENIEICKKAARVIGLDICGIDICCSDISKPMDGAIIEINAAPGIRMHEYPYEGKSRNVGEAIVKMLFKNEKCTVPLVAITGTNGKTTITRLISYALQLKGLNVGMTTTSGIYINNNCIEKGDTTGYNSALSILLNKDIDAAVLETARGGLVRKGLAYDLADVAIITNITEDHLGIDGINTMEDLAKVKSLVGEAVKPNGYVVLNGDDYWTSTVIERFKSKKIIFTKQKENSLMEKAIAEGGIGIYVNKGHIFIKKQDCEYSFMPIKNINITLKGKLEYNIYNSMAVIGALISLNVEEKFIVNALKTFGTGENENIGRFNIFDIQGRKVILDYGHNIDGYKVVLNSLKNFPHKRLIGVIGVPGDRTDTSVLQCGKIAGENLDVIFIKEDYDKRGRKEGEIASILKEGVLSTGTKETLIKIELHEQRALEKAIDFAEPGDIVIIFFDNYEKVLEVVNNKYTIEEEKKSAIN